MTTLRQGLEGFDYRAIATLTLQLEKSWSMPVPMMMLDENIASHQYGQWIFSRPDHSDQVTVVVSDAPDLLKIDRDMLVEAISTQIRMQCQRHPNAIDILPPVIHHRLIVEKRATFDARVGLHRPSATTPWPRLTLAGDWTDTGYPAVLEGAVRSGLHAAKILLQNQTIHAGIAQ
jgi:predicted NAD/FAD-dependent oxidoreductase